MQLEGLLFFSIVGLFAVIFVVYVARKRPEVMHTRLKEFQELTGLRISPKVCVTLWVLAFILAIGVFLAITLSKSEPTAVYPPENTRTTISHDWANLAGLLLFVVLVCPIPLAFAGRTLARIFFSNKSHELIQTAKNTYKAAIWFLLCISVVVPTALLVYSKNLNWFQYLLLTPIVTICTLGAVVWGLLRSPEFRHPSLES